MLNRGAPSSGAYVLSGGRLKGRDTLSGSQTREVKLGSEPRAFLLLGGGWVQAHSTLRGGCGPSDPETGSAHACCAILAIVALFRHYATGPGAVRLARHKASISVNPRRGNGIACLARRKKLMLRTPWRGFGQWARRGGGCGCRVGDNRTIACLLRACA